jgi:undecaprenyl diphosphate synthase
VEKSKNNTGIILNLAINYGGQAEIIRATKNISSDVKNGIIDVNEIDNELFEQYLYTNGLPVVDLLIRPGGDFRISNFLLWQIAYAEIWVSDVFWPDFTEDMLMQAIFDFQKRDRRYGGINTDEKLDVNNEN